MKMGVLLSISLCFIAVAAAAAGTPGSTPAAQTSKAGKTTGVAATAGKTSGSETAAPLAISVADFYKKGEQLNGKKVTLHGTAVKVTGGIMGKTWTHIEDGTGDKAKKTNDVICISKVTGARVGEVVTVAGTVKFNPDNPRYRLMLEDAVFK